MSKDKRKEYNMENGELVMNRIILSKIQDLLLIVILSLILVSSILCSVKIIAGQTETFIIIITLFSVVSFIACCLVLINSRSTRKINRLLADYLQSAAQNGMHEEIPEVLKSRDDDIGKAANALEYILITYGEKNRQENETEIRDKILNSLDSLGSEIKNAIEITDNFAKTMGETTDTSENIAASTLDIAGSVQFITEKTSQGVITAEEIEKRAEELKNRVIESKQKAQMIFDGTKTELETAIENAKVVEQISILSESIIQITAQTNLLALNHQLKRQGQERREEVLRL